MGVLVGGVAGGIAGGISDANRPRFHEYVEHQRPRSYHYKGDVAVGGVLPDTDVTYYDVRTNMGFANIATPS